jgi:hypothetical protein
MKWIYQIWNLYSILYIVSNQSIYVGNIDLILMIRTKGIIAPGTSLYARH